MTELYIDNETGMDCLCDNCGHECKTDQVEMIADAQERLTPGGVVPAGQCPECGGLTYLKVEAKPAPVTTHRGVPVFCSGKTPNFHASYRNQRFSGGSFKTLRDKLDSAIEFTPFTALRFAYKGDSGTVEVVSITGIERDNGPDKLRYVTDAGRKLDSWAELYPDTAVMRERMETHLAEREEFARREADIKAGQQAERNAMEALRLPKLES